MITPSTPETPEELRDQTNIREFLRPDQPVMAGLKLRPFSAAALAILREIDNVFVTGKIDGCKNIEFEIVKFLYVMGGPEEDVRELVWDQTAFKKAALAFGATISLSDISTTMGDIKNLIEPSMTAMVKVIEPKKKGPERPDVDPNAGN